MILDDFLAALALVLVIEGLMPTAFPQMWQNTMRAMGEASPQTIRKIGLGSLIAGAVLLYFVRG